MAALHPGWENLISWLRGHGMNSCLVEGRATPGAGYGLFAAQDVETSRPLLHIPPKAMMNIKTLSPLYRPVAGKKALTAIQMVCLHLALHRPKEGHPSTCSRFGPYISVLPTEFDGHPLTWRVCEDPIGKGLLQHLTPTAQRLFEKLYNRFENDVQEVHKFLQSNRQPPVNIADFLWGWLNVNSRCFYHRLKPTKSDPDNLTLVPLVDFANHRPFSAFTHMKPMPTQADTFDTAPIGPGEAFWITSPSEQVVESGEEMFFEYGRHSNATLFVEYGFVNAFERAQIEDGEFEAEVDVHDCVEAIILEKGEVGRWMREVLENEGYWGDWTLHSSPAPAYPSYRLITALQLYCLSTEQGRDMSYLEEHKDGLLQPWKNVVLGRAQRISEANERAWRECLLGICITLRQRAEKMPNRLANVQAAPGGWSSYAVDCIRKLWVEEEVVAAAVENSVHRGIEF